MNSRTILLVLLTLGTLAALAATPVGAGFAFKPFACDFGSSPDWVATIVNVRHLLSFGVLAVLAFLVFRGQPIWAPIVFMLVVTGVVEIEEGLFASGHCRMRDMIPDVLAIGIGWIAARFVPSRWLKAA